jgi:hypothetical protein
MSNQVQYENPFSDDQELAERYAKGRASTEKDSAFLGALRGGVSSLKGTSVSALSAGAHAIGLDSVGSKLDRSAAKTMAQSQGESFLTPSLQDVNNAQSLGRWVAGNIASNIPLFGSLALGGAAGGVLGAATHGKRGLAKAIDKANTKELEKILEKDYGASASTARAAENLIKPADEKDFLKNAVSAGLSRVTLRSRIGSDIGSILPYAVQTSGENEQAYQNDPNSTATEKEKARMALKLGLAESIVGSYVSPMAVLQRFTKAEKAIDKAAKYSGLSKTEKSKMLAKAAAKEWLHAGVNESATELFEDSISQWGGRQLNPDLDYNVAQGIESGLAGGVVGGAMASPAALSAMHRARKTALDEEEQAFENSPEGTQQKIDALDTEVPESEKDFTFHLVRSDLLQTKAVRLLHTTTANPADIIQTFKDLKDAQAVAPTNINDKDKWIHNIARLEKASQDLLAAHPVELASFAHYAATPTTQPGSKPRGTPEEELHINGQVDKDLFVSLFLAQGNQELVDLAQGKDNLDVSTALQGNDEVEIDTATRGLALKLHRMYETMLHNPVDQELSTKLLTARNELFEKTGVVAIPFSPVEKKEQIAIFTAIKDTSKDPNIRVDAIERIVALSLNVPDHISDSLKLEERTRVLHPDVLPNSFFDTNHTESDSARHNRIDSAYNMAEAALEKNPDNPLLAAQVERLNSTLAQLEISEGKIRPSSSEEVLRTEKVELESKGKENLTPREQTRLLRINGALMQRARLTARGSTVSDEEAEEQRKSETVKKVEIQAKPQGLPSNHVLSSFPDKADDNAEFGYVGVDRSGYAIIKGKSGLRQYSIVRIPPTINELIGQPADSANPAIPPKPIYFGGTALEYGEAAEMIVKAHTEGKPLDYKAFYREAERQYHESRPLIPLDGHTPTPLMVRSDYEGNLIHIPSESDRISRRAPFVAIIPADPTGKIVIKHTRSGVLVEIPVNLEDLLIMKKKKADNSFTMANVREELPNVAKYNDKPISAESIGAALAEANKNRTEAMALAEAAGEEFDPNTPGTFVTAEEIFTLARHSFEFRGEWREVGTVVVKSGEGGAVFAEEATVDSDYYRANPILAEYNAIPVKITSEPGPEHMRLGVAEAVKYFYNLSERKVLLGTMDNKLFFVTPEKRQEFLDDYKLRDTLEGNINFLERIGTILKKESGDRKMHKVDHIKHLLNQDDGKGGLKHESDGTVGIIENAELTQGVMRRWVTDTSAPNRRGYWKVDKGILRSPLQFRDWKRAINTETGMVDLKALAASETLTEEQQALNAALQFGKKQTKTTDNGDAAEIEWYRMFPPASQRGGSVNYQQIMFSDNDRAIAYAKQDRARLSGISNAIDEIYADNPEVIRKIALGMSPADLISQEGPLKLLTQFKADTSRAYVFASEELLDALIPLDKKALTKIKGEFAIRYQRKYEGSRSECLLLPETYNEMNKIWRKRNNDRNLQEGDIVILHRDPALPDASSMAPFIFRGIATLQNDFGSHNRGIVVHSNATGWAEAAGDFDGDSGVLTYPDPNLIPAKQRQDTNAPGISFMKYGADKEEPYTKFIPVGAIIAFTKPGDTAVTRIEINADKSNLIIPDGVKMTNVTIQAPIMQRSIEDETGGVAEPEIMGHEKEIDLVGHIATIRATGFSQMIGNIMSLAQKAAEIGLLDKLVYIEKMDRHGNPVVNKATGLTEETHVTFAILAAKLGQASISAKKKAAFAEQAMKAYKKLTEFIDDNSPVERDPQTGQVLMRTIKHGPDKGKQVPIKGSYFIKLFRDISDAPIRSSESAKLLKALAVKNDALFFKQKGYTPQVFVKDGASPKGYWGKPVTKDECLEVAFMAALRVLRNYRNDRFRTLEDILRSTDKSPEVTSLQLQARALTIELRKTIDPVIAKELKTPFAVLQHTIKYYGGGIEAIIDPAGAIGSTWYALKPELKNSPNYFDNTPSMHIELAWRTIVLKKIFTAIDLFSSGGFNEALSAAAVKLSEESGKNNPTVHEYLRRTNEYYRYLSNKRQDLDTIDDRQEIESYLNERSILNSQLKYYYNLNVLTGSQLIAYGPQAMAARLITIPELEKIASLAKNAGTFRMSVTVADKAGNKLLTSDIIPGIYKAADDGSFTLVRNLDNTAEPGSIKLQRYREPGTKNKIAYDAVDPLPQMREMSDIRLGAKDEVIIIPLDPTTGATRQVQVNTLSATNETVVKAQAEAKAQAGDMEIAFSTWPAMPASDVNTRPGEPHLSDAQRLSQAITDPAVASGAKPFPLAPRVYEDNLGKWYATFVERKSRNEPDYRKILINKVYHYFRVERVEQAPRRGADIKQPWVTYLGTDYNTALNTAYAGGSLPTVTRANFDREKKLKQQEIANMPLRKAISDYVASISTKAENAPTVAEYNTLLGLLDPSTFTRGGEFKALYDRIVEFLPRVIVSRETGRVLSRESDKEKAKKKRQELYPDLLNPAQELAAVKFFVAEAARLAATIEPVKSADPSLVRNQIKLTLPAIYDDLSSDRYSYNEARVARDMERSSRATTFIGSHDGTAWAAHYASLWGNKVNTGQYTKDDIVFVVVNSPRLDGTHFNDDTAEAHHIKKCIEEAAKAGAKFLFPNIKLLLAVSEDRAKARVTGKPATKLEYAGEYDAATFLNKLGLGYAIPTEKSADPTLWEKAETGVKASSLFSANADAAINLDPDPHATNSLAHVELRTMNSAQTTAELQNATDSLGFLVGHAGKTPKLINAELMYDALIRTGIQKNIDLAGQILEYARTQGRKTWADEKGVVHTRKGRFGTGTRGVMLPQSDGTVFIYVAGGKHDTKAAQLGILAHELGHWLIDAEWAHLNDIGGNKVLAAKIRAAALAHMSKKNIPVSEAAFHEWCADNIASWITTNPVVRSGMDTWFKRVADNLKRMWSKIRELFAGVEGRQTDGTNTFPKADANVEEWMNSLLKLKDPQEVVLAYGPDNPSGSASTISIVDRIAQRKVRLKRWADTGNMDIQAVDEIIPYIRDNLERLLTPGDAQTLQRVSQEPNMQRRLSQLLKPGSKAAQAVAADYKTAAAYVYVLTSTGVLVPSQQVRSILSTLGDLIMQKNRKSLEATSAENDAVIESFAKADLYIPATESLIDTDSIAHRLILDRSKRYAKGALGAAQKTTQTYNELLGGYLNVPYGQVLATGIPSLIKFANTLQPMAWNLAGFKPLGAGERGKAQSQRWFVEAADIVVKLTEAGKKDLLGLLYPLKGGDTPVVPPNVTAAHERIKRLLAKIFEYENDPALVKYLAVPNRKDYWPMIPKNDYIRDNMDSTVALYLGEQSFKDGWDDVKVHYIDWINSNQDPGDESNITVAVAKVKAMTQPEFVKFYLERDDEHLLPGWRLHQLRSGVTSTPGFRFKNPRELNFLLGSKDKATHERVLETLETDPTVVLARYARNATKRVEFARLVSTLPKLRKKDATGEMVTDPLGSFAGLWQQVGLEAEDSKAAAKAVALTINYVDAVNGQLGLKQRDAIDHWLEAMYPNNPEAWVRANFHSGGGQIMNENLNNIRSGLHAYVDIVHLSLNALTSLVDPLGVLVKMGDGKAFIKVMNETRASLINQFKGMPPGAVDLMLKQAGVESHSFQNEDLQATYNGPETAMWAQKLLGQWFKMIGVDAIGRGTSKLAGHGSNEKLIAWAKGAQVGAAGTAEELARHGLTWEDVRTSTEAELLGYGVEAAEAREKAGEVLHLLTFDEYCAAVDAGDTKEIERDLRVRGAIFRFVEESQVRPGATTRSLPMSNPYFSLLSIWRSYILAFDNQIGKPAWAKLGEEGNGYPLAFLILAYIPVLLFAEVIREAIKMAFSDNEDEDGNKSWTPPYRSNWTFGDYIGYAAGKAGLYGPSEIPIDAIKATVNSGMSKGIASAGGVLTSDIWKYDRYGKLPLPLQDATSNWSTAKSKKDSDVESSSIRAG